jgi:hypothetical protein
MKEISGKTENIQSSNAFNNELEKKNLGQIEELQLNVVRLLSLTFCDCFLKIGNNTRIQKGPNLFSNIKMIYQESVSIQF